jgi:hypothetical protein
VVLVLSPHRTGRAGLPHPACSRSSVRDMHNARDVDRQPEQSEELQVGGPGLIRRTAMAGLTGCLAFWPSLRRSSETFAGNTTGDVTSDSGGEFAASCDRSSVVGCSSKRIS